MIFDIKHINYEYIESLYNKKIPQSILDLKFGHERIKNQHSYNNFVFNLDIEQFKNYNVKNKYFYNDDLKKKIRTFYRKDFLFFKSYGFNYTLPN